MTGAYRIWWILRSMGKMTLSSFLCNGSWVLSPFSFSPLLLWDLDHVGSEFLENPLKRYSLSLFLSIKYTFCIIALIVHSGLKAYSGILQTLGSEILTWLLRSSEIQCYSFPFIYLFVPQKLDWLCWLGIMSFLPFHSEINPEILELFFLQVPVCIAFLHLLASWNDQGEDHLNNAYVRRCIHRVEKIPSHDNYPDSFFSHCSSIL